MLDFQRRKVIYEDMERIESDPMWTFRFKLKEEISCTVWRIALAGA